LLSIGDVIEIETGRKPGGWPVTHTPGGPSPSRPTGPGGRCPRPPWTSTWPTDGPLGEPLWRRGAPTTGTPARGRQVNTNTTSTQGPVRHPGRPRG
jgi:hypothetical protein